MDEKDQTASENEELEKKDETQSTQQQEVPEETPASEKSESIDTKPSQNELDAVAEQSTEEESTVEESEQEAVAEETEQESTEEESEEESNQAPVAEETEQESTEEEPIEEEAAQDVEEELEEEIEEEEPEEESFEDLAHIDFDLLDTSGRWFLKVLSGPNTGAEFSMQNATSYLIGTDAATCDVVFQDLSVSRQHARLAIDTQDNVTIEDLNSRNGTFVDGEKVSGKRSIESNVLLSMGTTTFMLVDREGERQTIVSPVLQPHAERKEELAELRAKEEEKGHKPPEMLEGALQEAAMKPLQTEVERLKEKERKEARVSQAISALVVLASITGLLIVVGVGTTFLFSEKEVKKEVVENSDQLISEALKDYPSIRYSYNPVTGKLLLLGHVLTPIERNRIVETMQGLTFISQIDYSNIVIDEFVWREMNNLIAKNPDWRGVTISSPIPGKFVISGFLKTRKQAEALFDYMSQNFLYLDLLERRVVVEEELDREILQRLQNVGFRNIDVKFIDGDLTITGSIPNGSMPKYQKFVSKIREIPGIRSVRSLVQEVAPEQAMINISDRYRVTGYSLQGGNITVVINGRILMKGDSLDGLTITDIQPSAVFLEKGQTKYRIDF